MDAPSRTEEDEKFKYIERISAKSDHYGNRLIELMERTHKSNTQEVTLSEAKHFYEEMERKDESDNDMAAVGFPYCLQSQAI